MNHENSCILEGFILEIKQEKTPEGLEKHTVLLETHKESEYKGIKKHSKFKTFIVFWGKRTQLLTGLSRQDEVRITGSFSFDIKKLDNGDIKAKNIIKADTIEKINKQSSELDELFG